MKLIYGLGVLFALTAFYPSTFAGKDDSSDDEDRGFQRRWHETGETCSRGGLFSNLFAASEMAQEVAQQVAPSPQPIHSINQRVILFPGSFSPPHRGHFETLRTQLIASPNSDVLIILNDSPRDSVSPQVGKEIWERYYFSLLRREFPGSQFSAEISGRSDPHDEALNWFRSHPHYFSGTVIAGEDRKDYAQSLHNPPKLAIMRKLEERSRFLSYRILPRDESGPDALSATRLRTCLRDSPAGGASSSATTSGPSSRPGNLDTCRSFFPTELSEAQFQEAAQWIIQQMRPATESISATSEPVSRKRRRADSHEE